MAGYLKHNEYCFICRHIVVIGIMAMFVITLTANNNPFPENLKAESPPFQCYLTHRTATFNDASDNNTFVKTDSVKSTDEGVVVYFKTFAGEVSEISEFCFLINGLSLGGQQMIVKENGDNYIINFFGDTILIKTSVDVNQSWTAYMDDKLKIEATVIEIADIQIMDITDRVKTIEFRTYDLEGNPLQHHADKKSILLSEKYGLIRTFNFNQFPGHADYYTLSGLTNPDIGVTNLTWLKVNDHQPGDVLHVKTESIDWFITSFRYEVERTIYTWLSRNDYADSLVYNIARFIQTETKTDPQGSSVYTYFKDTIHTVISPWSVFDRMAGEPIIEDYYMQLLVQHQIIAPSHTGVIKYFDSQTYDYNPESPCWTPVHYDGPGGPDAYYKGLGGPYYNSDWYFSQSSRKLIYFEKDGTTWGTPFNFTNVDAIQKEVYINIFPNPTTGSFYLNLPQQFLPAVAVITDMGGRGVGVHEITTPSADISMEGLAPGLYFITVISKEEIIHNGKIILKSL